MMAPESVLASAGRNQGKDLAHDAPCLCKARAQGLYVSPDLSNVMLNVLGRRTVTARTDSQVVRLELGWGWGVGVMGARACYL